jgi:hypothetical protein
MRLHVALLIGTLSALAPGVALAQEADFGAEGSVDGSFDTGATAPADEPAPETEGAPPPVDASEVAPDAHVDEVTSAETAPPEPLDVAPEAAPAAPERVKLQVSAGAGMGTLSFTRPTAAGAQTLPRTAFPAAAITMRLQLWPSQQSSLEFSVAYQTSLGLELETEPLFGLSQSVPTRTERAELSAAPVIRLGTSASALALAFPVSFAFRAFVPELHQFGLPKYVIGGPQLRVELIAPLGELVSLRVGPEAQWLLIVDGSLSREGACCQGGSIGGQASLEGNVGPTFSVFVTYRETHGQVGSGQRKFIDLERYLTANIAGRL